MFIPLTMIMMAIVVCALAIKQNNRLGIVLNSLLIGSLTIQLLVFEVAPPLTKFESILKENGYTVTKVK